MNERQPKATEINRSARIDMEELWPELGIVFGVVKYEGALDDSPQTSLEMRTQFSGYLQNLWAQNEGLADFANETHVLFGRTHIGSVRDEPGRGLVAYPDGVRSCKAFLEMSNACSYVLLRHIGYLSAFPNSLRNVRSYDSSDFVVAPELTLVRGSDYVAGRYRRSGIAYLPIVTSDLSLSCRLTIDIRRTAPTGCLFRNPGDLDRCIRQIVDALTIPVGESPADPSDELESPHMGPVCCLLESTDLIAGLEVRSEHILNPQATEPSQTAIVTIEAVITPTGITCNNRGFLAGFA